MLPLLNLLLTLLFLGSFVIIIYCIALVFARKSKEIRFKALRIAILPVVYIVAVLLYSKYILVEKKKVIIKELIGKYVYDDTTYERDSIFLKKVQITLASNKTFRYENLAVPDPIINGIWDIDNRTTTIQFTDLKGKIVWEAYKKVIANKPNLIFTSKGQKINFKKII